MDDQLAFFESDIVSNETDQPAEGASFAPPSLSDDHLRQWTRISTRQQQEQLDKRLRAAAACGYEEVVLELLSLGANPNAHDSHTGWTSLHWAAALRRVKMMAVLERNAASFLEVAQTKETPLDFIGEELSSYQSSYFDRNIPQIKNSNKKNPTTATNTVLYTWGDGSNYTLGRESTAKTSSDFARLVSFQFAENVHVASVSCSQYHSAAVATDGSLWTWGIGEGGRLGYSVDVQPLPRRVKSLGSEDVTQVFAKTQITAAVTASGKLYLFGRTDSGQFGDGNRKQKFEVPTAVTSLKKAHVVTVALSNVHVAAVSDDGRGESGQLGHGTNEEELLPRLVPLTNCRIVHVVCKDNLTALYNEKNDLYWFGLGSSRATRLKFSFGYPSLHRAGSFQVISLCCADSAIFFLVDEGSFGRNVYAFRPLVDSVPFVVTDFSQAREGVQIESAQGSLFLVTRLGAVWSLPLAPLLAANLSKTSNKPAASNSPSKPNNLSVSPTLKSNMLTSSLSSSTSSNPSANSMAEVRIHQEIRPIRIAASSHHFAAVCHGPRAPLLDIPITPSSWKSEIADMLSDVSQCDVAIVHPGTKKELIFCHSLFLSRSPVLKSLLATSSESRTPEGKIAIESQWGVNVKAWQSIWKYLTTDEIDLNDDDSAVVSKESKLALTESVRNLALGLKLNSLFTLLAYNRQLKDNESLERTPPLSEYLLKTVHDNTNSAMTIGADIRIVALKETEPWQITAHSSILLARSEYFRTMLKASWREAHQKTVHLEENSVDSVRALLVYLYADELASGLSANLLVELLFLADRMFLPRLRDLCASTLLKSVTPENAMQLLEIAQMCGYDPLKEGVIEYIAINLELFLRSRLLGQMDEDTLAAVEHFVAVHFLDAPYLHFTVRRQRYLEEFVQNVLSTKTPPKEKSSNARRNSAGDSETVEPLSSSPLKTSQTISSSPKPDASTVPEPSLSTSVDTLTSSGSNIPLSASGGPLTPAQRKQLKKGGAPESPQKPSEPSTPPQSPPKPAWSTSPMQSSTQSPSLSDIMSQESQKGLKTASIPAHLLPNKATSPKTAKSWSTTSAASPPKFEDIEKEQFKEKTQKIPGTSPNKGKDPIQPNSKNSTPTSSKPIAVNFDGDRPSTSVSISPVAPVVHRHMWGAPTSAVSISNSGNNSKSGSSFESSSPTASFLAPTPMDSLALKASPKPKGAKGQPQQPSSGPWMQQTPNLLNIMSEQYIEKIVKEDEPKPQPDKVKEAAKTPTPDQRGGQKRQGQGNPKTKRR